ncbi:hypothetical protein K6119_14000 [Paracrocinitomix mangrovi]|uniref:hypothetical protein n=1 Tax=Paracrocinitomix mangrovi TaxID=2862509 RepID=UPI001C8E4E14|nr:hypothetical protein [Paracrocinitomix mangrovi]UKN00843.1 hypothetical protein K6119_14000 [Paracrocinitomix mangrovi]
MKYLILFLFSVSLVACSSADDEYYQNQENDNDDDEELSEFDQVLEDFETAELPYESATTYDSYNPSEYLSSEDYQLLQLYMVFSDGYFEDMYSATNKITTDSGIQMITVSAINFDEELSTYLITYDERGWYLSNLRLSFDQDVDDPIQMESKVTKDEVVIKTIVNFAGEQIISEEVYKVNEDGTFTSEQEV